MNRPTDFLWKTKTVLVQDGVRTEKVSDEPPDGCLWGCGVFGLLGTVFVFLLLIKLIWKVVIW